MSVEIPLGGDWFLLSDPNQWILGKKQGKRIYGHYFYGRLENALTSIIELRLRHLNVKDIPEFKESLLCIYADVCKAILMIKEAK